MKQQTQEMLCDLTSKVQPSVEGISAYRLRVCGIAFVCPFSPVSRIEDRCVAILSALQISELSSGIPAGSIAEMPNNMTSLPAMNLKLETIG